MDKQWGLTAKVVIRDPQGRMLLLRRSNKCRNFVGYWEWPGGKVDPGEDFAAAAVREAFEETGLRVQLLGYATTFYFQLPKVHVVNVCLEAGIVGGDLKISDEHDASAWVACEKLAEYQLIDSHRPAMLAYGMATPAAGRQ